MNVQFDKKGSVQTLPAFDSEATALAKEQLRADSIRDHFSTANISPTTTSHLKRILDKQFYTRIEPEVGGGIFQRPGDPELRVVVPKMTKILAQAYREFVSGGDERAAAILIVFLEHNESSESQFSQVSQDHISKLKSFVKHGATSRPFDLEGIDPNHTYRMALLSLINSWYPIAPGEAGQYQEGFLGFFHCHQNGSLPSPGDLWTNQDNHIPNLVISAQEVGFNMYQVNLYLVALGKSELIFTGNLA